MKEKVGRKIANKNKNLIFIIVVVLIILALNAIFIFSNLKKRAYFEAYGKENLAESFKRQFPYAEFETITQKKEGELMAIVGYVAGGKEVCCAVYTKEIFFERWYFQRGAALNKTLNPSTCIVIPSYGKVFLSWNLYGIKQVVMVKGEERTEMEIAPDEFFFQLVDDETDEVHFYTDEGKEISADVAFPL